MKLHHKTLAKIEKLFSISLSYTETQEEQYNTYPDMMFIIESYVDFVSSLKFRLKNKEDYTQENYHDEIYEYDSMISAWREHLVYQLPDENNENHNDLYSVLFSTLQAVDSLIDDDHFYWEEDESNEIDLQDTDESSSEEFELDRTF